ncbi:hypothetical protein SISNIDRAFT_458550 [Sistotremastrum niveocremeum HHB9708]|uniref:Uncharacterized protein n=1 Tax=Sistotremastrum niveocremeum HHB9708 TaxID=1314777 RepID=A0A164QEZ7_9AGAM|nr:hypothetical protein SISNIDRAFT_458550 [Sistotremastrum niveocremeum HHB9708]
MVAQTRQQQKIKIKRITRSSPKLEPSRGQPIRDQRAMPNDRPDDTPRPTRGARMCHGSNHETRL